MRIEALELFVAAAETRSLSQAAKQLFVTQQGASKTIRALEQELNAELFVRTSTGLELTQMGERVLAEARTIRDSYQRILVAAAARAASPVKGAVNIVTTPFITNQLSVVLSEFEKAFPELQVRIIERSPFKIINDYMDPNAHNAMRFADEEETLRLVTVPDFALRMRESLRGSFTELISSVLVANGMQDSPLGSYENITARQMATLPVVYYNEEFLNKLVHRQFAGVEPTICLRTSNIGMFTNALVNDRMITFSDSLSVFLNPQAVGFVNVPITDGVGFSIGYLGVPAQGSAAACFVDFCQRYFATVCALYLKQYASSVEAVR